MSRIAPQIPTQSTVAPGTVMSSPYYTPTGWSAGEYIYSTPTGIISPRTTGGIGYNATYNAGAVLSGSSWTPATLQNVQYGPMFDYGTFSGTSQTAGQQNGTSTTIDSVTAYNVYSFNLINGNTCTVYSTSGVMYFTITSSSGSVVVAPTAISGSSTIPTDRFQISGCCLASGNLVFTYYNGNMYYAVYTQAGVLVTTSTYFESGTTLRYHQTIALANGNWAIVGSSSTATQYIKIYTPSGTDVLGGLVPTGITQIGQSSCAQLAGGNIAFAGFDASNSRIGLGVITQSGSSVYSTYPDSSNAYQTTVLPFAGGTFAVVYTNSGGSIAIRVSSPTSSSAIYQNVMGSTNTSAACSAALQLSASLVPTVYAFGYGGGNMSLYSAEFTNTSGASATISSINTSIPNGSTNNFSAVNSLNGRILLSWRSSATNYPTQGFWNIQTLVSGSTVLYGGNFTPKQNWFLLGVAASTVTAGGTGQVITNGGSVTLNANYPTITTPISFNYQGASNNFAQRGTVVNKAVTLKGLEL